MTDFMKSLAHEYWMGYLKKIIVKDIRDYTKHMSKKYKIAFEDILPKIIKNNPKTCHYIEAGLELD